MAPIVFVLCFVFLASSVASFLAVVAERTQRGESINGRSHCSCGRKLFWNENIPVLGWIAALGKTKCCNNRIPTRYVVTEAIAGVFGLYLGLSTMNYFLDPVRSNLVEVALGTALVGMVLFVEFFILRALAKKDMAFMKGEEE